MRAPELSRAKRVRIPPFRSTAPSSALPRLPLQRCLRSPSASLFGGDLPPEPVLSPPSPVGTSLPEIFRFHCGVSTFRDLYL